MELPCSCGGLGFWTFMLRTQYWRWWKVDMSDYRVLFLCGFLPVWGLCKVTNPSWSLIKAFSLDYLFMLFICYGRKESLWLASAYSSDLNFFWQLLQVSNPHSVCSAYLLSFYFPRTHWTTIRGLSQCHQWKLVKFSKLLLSGSK